MTIWPPAPEALTRPAYRSLARALDAAIRAGELAPGDRLPTHRDLAWSLGLSVQTVSRAYEELIRAGAVVGEVGRGTFVRPAREAAEPPYQRLDGQGRMIDCSLLTPVVGAPHEAAMRRTLSTMAQEALGPEMHSFRPRESLSAHVDAALGWLDGCGMRPAPEQVVPTNGSTPAMTVALTLAAAPGDLVATEALGHHTLRGLTQALGLRLVGLPTDGEGIEPQAFARACAHDRITALYTMPAGLSARATRMGEARRAEIAAIARRHDVMIVENDAWGPLEPRRPAPLSSHAPERSFYVTGLSKCLLPGLRIGWLVAPAALATAAHERHAVTGWMAAGVLAAIATRWIENGTAAHLLHWQRDALGRRNRLAARKLRGLPVRRTSRGLHVWLDLPDPRAEAAFVADARARGIAVAAGAAFAADDGPRPCGVRISLGAASDAQLSAALAEIAALASEMLKE